MAPTTPLRIVVAEDSALLRDGIVRLLTAHGLAVVGEAGDAEQLVEVVEREAPDVVVTDIRMPPTHTDEGVRAALRIRADRPGTALLVLSQHLETAYAVDLLGHAPARVGYLLKDRITDPDQLIEAVRRVAAGECVVDPLVVQRLVDRPRRGDPLAAITERERDVLRLMAEGRSNAAIADRLAMSPKTVETHVRSIFQKLDLPAEVDDHRRVLAVLTYLRAA